MGDAAGRCVRFWFVGVAMMISLASVALAGDSYDYVGENYDQVLNDYDTSMKVTGSFTIPSFLGPDLAWRDIGKQVTSYSFFDGVQTLTDANSDIIQFKVATDSLCRISEWAITAWLVNGNFVDGIDVYFRSPAKVDNGFIAAPCVSPCSMLDVLTARHYGIIVRITPSSSMSWSQPANCPGVIFANGFETGDVSDWSASTP